MSSLNEVHRTEPGWYRGDFHAHTNCSDGVLTPCQLRELAVEQGLDFLAITDHNDLRAFDDFTPGSEPLVLPGIEVTFGLGHFNVFGFDGDTPDAQEIFGPILGRPYREIARQYEEDDLLKDLLEKIREAGYLASLNHPLLIPWEWKESRTLLPVFESVELVNDPTYRGRYAFPYEGNYTANPLTRRMWSAWLNNGYRLTGLGGTDFHASNPSDDRNRASRLNLPFTAVYAEELSGGAILTAVRRRHAYLSMGPSIQFYAESNGQTYRMGDDLGSLDGPVRFYAFVEGASGPAEALLVQNGKAVVKASVQNGWLELEWVVQLDPEESFWLRLDVIDPEDQAIAITNPIFAGPVPRRRNETFGTFLYRGYPAA